MSHERDPCSQPIGVVAAADGDFRAALLRFSDILLALSSSPEQRRDATQQLFWHCIQRSGVISEQQSLLPGGIALSPADAAHCLLDVARTRGFLLGVDGALRIALARFDERPIRVLYAGCGPFAPLALPLACRYRADEVVFHLVDVHPSALAIAAALFVSAGAADSLVAADAIDATKLRLGPLERPHILVAELMQRALSREPQVAVLAALGPQCRPGALLVPQSIAVRAVLMRMPSPASESPRIALELGPLIELAIATNAQGSTPGQPAAAGLPPTQIAVPDDAPKGCLLALCTRIETIEGHFIGDFESGLTQPQVLFNLGTIAPGSIFEFAYRLGEQPGFECRRCTRSSE
jgi:hypothetical protein